MQFLEIVISWEYAFTTSIYLKFLNNASGGINSARSQTDCVERVNGVLIPSYLITADLTWPQNEMWNNSTDYLAPDGQCLVFAVQTLPIIWDVHRKTAVLIWRRISIEGSLAWDQNISCPSWNSLQDILSQRPGEGERVGETLLGADPSALSSITRQDRTTVFY